MSNYFFAFVYSGDFMGRDSSIIFLSSLYKAPSLLHIPRLYPISQPFLHSYPQAQYKVFFIYVLNNLYSFYKIYRVALNVLTSINSIMIQITSFSLLSPLNNMLSGPLHVAVLLYVHLFFCF